jgi:hypothetical protein
MAELALAKLGDKYYYKKVLKECSYNSSLINYDTLTGYEPNAWTKDFNAKSAKLFFLATPESLFMLNYWMDTSKISVNNATSNGNIDFAYSSYKLLYHLYRAFGKFDLMKEYRRRNEIISPQTAEAVLSFKNWLIQNKGKYKLNQPCPE